MTLRTRFALWVAGLLLVGMAGFGVFVYFSMAQGLTASIDDFLQLSAQQAVTTIDIENGQIDVDEGLQQSGDILRLRERGLTLRILDPAGQILAVFGPYQSLLLEPSFLESELANDSYFATLTDPREGDPVRVYTNTILSDGHLVGFVQIAQSLEEAHEALRRLLVALLVGAPLLALAAALGGYFLAGRALAPIDKITRTARRISVEDLSARLGLHVADDEVGRLAVTLDEMLGRLDHAFRRERQFTADAAHELRTPLAAMQAILSVIREKKRTAEEYEQALADLAEETGRLQSLAENLLQLARGDFRQPAAQEMVDLHTLLTDITVAMGPLVDAKGLRLHCQVPVGITLRADKDGLIRLFVNLLDNAIKFTESGEIRVSADAGPRGVRIAVSDPGPGIPPEHLPYIFDRFYRVDPSRSGSGAGLGLAIASEIARAHGGALEAQSAVGRGTTIIANFPSSG